MEDQKKMVKEDINFLEYPNWVVNQRSKVTTWTIEKPNGKYELVCGSGMPSHFDKTLLYFLLYKLYREKKLDSCLISTTRYEIAKNVFSELRHIGKNKYDRIMESLKKWNALSIHFSGGIFYGGDGETERFFHILDEVILRKETGELIVKFNSSYIKQLKESKFYTFIDFEKYKKLYRASSARLYEILVKNFKGRNDWVINIQLLAQKLTFEKRANAAEYYPSDVFRHIKPGINEINKKTDLEIGFTYNKETGTCIFKSLKKQNDTFIPATRYKETDKQKRVQTRKQINDCMDYYRTLAIEEQEAILEDIKRQPFLEFLPDQSSRIFAYMTNAKQWQPSE